MKPLAWLLLLGLFAITTGCGSASAPPLTEETQAAIAQEDAAVQAAESAQK